MLNNVLHLVLVLYRDHLPLDVLTSILDADDAAHVRDIILGYDERTLRSQFIIAVNAQDAATAVEERKQELLTLNQLLLGYYEKMLQFAQIAAAIPEPFRGLLIGMMEKIESGMRHLLSTVESIPNPDDILFQVAELERVLRSVSPTAAMGAMQEGTAPGGGMMGGGMMGDLGGGVA